MFDNKYFQSIKNFFIIKVTELIFCCICQREYIFEIIESKSNFQCRS